MYRVILILLLGSPLVWSTARAQTDDLFVVNNNAVITRVSPQGTVTPYATAKGIAGVGAIGFARDFKGNLYLAAPEQEPGAPSAASYAIYRMDTSGQTTVFARGFPQLGMLAFDAHGNLFADTINCLFKISPAGTVTKLPTNISGPSGLAFDQKGALFVANIGDGTIRKVNAATGVNEIFARGFDHPEGLAFDDAGNLFVTDFYAGMVMRVSPTGVVSSFAQVRQARNLAIGPDGNLYVSSEGAGAIFKVNPTGGVSVFANQLNYPLNLSFNHPLLKLANADAPASVAPAGSPALIIACAAPAVILLAAIIIWLLFRKKEPPPDVNSSPPLA